MKDLSRDNLHLIIVSGFGGDKDIIALEDAIAEKVNPAHSLIIKGCPPHKAFRHPEGLVADIREKIENASTDNILLIGHSYGALLALAASLRMRMKNILKLILIDGPLNIGQPVIPTKLAHYMFKRQYDYRLKLATNCMDDISRQGSEQIVTIANRDDRIIPFEMKNLPNMYNTQAHEDPEHGVRFLRRVGGNKGLNITLPPNFIGHSLRPKVQIITSIIEKLIPEDTMQQSNHDLTCNRQK